MKRKAGGIFVLLLVVCGLCMLLYQGWKRFGIVEDSRETESLQKLESMEKPVIYARDIKVKQGERLSVNELCRVFDGDGTDLLAYLKMKTVSGMAVQAVDTEKAGIYDRILFVQSPVSGKRTEKRIRILVDGKQLGKMSRKSFERF